MKRLILRYALFLVVVPTLISTLWVGGAYFWLQHALRNRFAPADDAPTHALAALVTAKPNRALIRSALNRVTRSPDIVMAVVSDEHRKIVYARDTQKRNTIVWPLRVSYPLIDDGRITGWLTLWPSPEAVYAAFVKKGNLPVVLAWFVSWWAAVLLSLFVYFRRHLYVPLRKIVRFIRGLGRKDNPPLEAPEKDEWRDLFARFNHINDSIADTEATMQMLFSVSQTLTSHIEVNELFNIVIEIIRKKFSDAPCAVAQLGEDGFLKVRIQRGLSPETVRSLHLRPGEGPSGQAFVTGQPVIVNDAARVDSAFTKLLVEHEGILSYVSLPLLIDGKCTGLLNVGCREKNFFNDDIVATLSMLAKYLSIALRNAQLYERVQELNRRLETEVSTTTRELTQTNSRLIHKVREMKALSDIAAFAAAKVNLTEILEMIVEKIKELLTAQAAGFFLYVPETGEMVPHAPFFGIKDRDLSRLRFRLEEARTLASVTEGGSPVVINDGTAAAEAIPMLSTIIALQSLALVPLRSGKKNIGVLGVANKFSAPFCDDDLRILALIADRISGIIENVRLYQELERRLHDLTVLQEISSAISSEPVWEKTLGKVISTTTQSFGADLCALLLYDEKNRELVTQPGAYFTGGDEAVLLRIPVDDANSLSAQVFRSGEPFLSPDASIDPRVKSQTARLWDVRSLILVPLRAENRVIGVLRIGRHQANRFAADDLCLASLIAHQAATIIENAHLYDSLREAKGELEQLNQIKNEFISMVSHELRTPLTAVKGFVQIVLQGEAGPLGAQQEKFLQIADQSIDRLTVLISDLLDISRIESGQMRLTFAPLDPKDVIGAVALNITPEAARKKLSIKVAVPENFPLIMADRERLIQVFNNLVLNSTKFTPEGGTITISGVDKGDFVIFSVADTGIGIDQKEHQKIFEKFYQVDSGTTRSGSGTGLGLAIVKSIIEMHGGQIWVESEPGRGANFQFLIPRAKTEIKDFRRDAGMLGRALGRDAGAPGQGAV